MSDADFDRPSDAFSDDVEIYKYIGLTESFGLDYIKSVLESKTLYFRKVIMWEDVMESFLDRNVNKDSAELRYGSCWTTHQGIQRIVADENYPEALKAIKRNGVASMWKMYCPNGGIRIRTTIGKARGLISKFCETHGYAYQDGVVTSKYYSRTMKREEGRLCFLKSPNFYTDDEYRFVITAKDWAGDALLVPIDNAALFVDEALVFPPSGPTEKDTASKILDYLWEDIANKEFSYAELNEGKSLKPRRSVLYG